MLDKVKIILVEPLKAGNVGSVARAMKTMGLTRLVLVNPREFPHQDATMMAVHAQDVLENAALVMTLKEAIADAQVVFGTSARSRYMPQPFLEAQQAAPIIASQAQAGRQIAVVFGREDKGLSNEELNLCHFHMGINGDPQWGVLNLSHAVQVVSYLLYAQVHTHQQSTDAAHRHTMAHALADNAKFGWDKPPATHAHLMVIRERLLELMEKTGFYDQRKSKLLDERLQRLLLRISLDEMEANILLGVLSETIRKLP